MSSRPGRLSRVGLRGSRHLGIHPSLLADLADLQINDGTGQFPRQLNSGVPTIRKGIGYLGGVDNEYPHSGIRQRGPLDGTHKLMKTSHTLHWLAIDSKGSRKFICRNGRSVKANRFPVIGWSVFLDGAAPARSGRPRRLAALSRRSRSP